MVRIVRTKIYTEACGLILLLMLCWTIFAISSMEIELGIWSQNYSLFLASNFQGVFCGALGSRSLPELHESLMRGRKGVFYAQILNSYLSIHYGSYLLRAGFLS